MLSTGSLLMSKVSSGKELDADESELFQICQCELHDVDESFQTGGQ